MSASEAVPSFRDRGVAAVGGGVASADVPLAEPSAPSVAYATPQTRDVGPVIRMLRLPHHAESRASWWAWTAVAVGIALLYLYCTLSYWAPAHSGVDQNGYFVGGRQYALTLSTGLKPESDYGFIGRMWVQAPSGINYPKYPIGLPILYALTLWADQGLQYLASDAGPAAFRGIAGALRFDGREVAHLLSPVSAALATLGVFAIVRRLSGGFVGVMAMLLLACGQVMLSLAVNPNSHAACTATVVWGMFFLLSWLETGALWRGLACGFLIGFAVLIRYTEGLLLLPLAVGMLYAARWAVPGVRRLLWSGGATLLFAAVATAVAHFWGASLIEKYAWLTPMNDDEGRPTKVLIGALTAASLVAIFVRGRTALHLLAVGVAWLVPVVYQTVFNMVHMRAFTSYAGTNESTGFSMDYFQFNWEKMIRILNDQGLFFIAPIALLGIILMFRRLPLVATLLLLWFVPSILLYTSYYWAPDNLGVSYARFVLTQLPAMVVSAAWLLGEVSRRLSQRRRLRADATVRVLAIALPALVVGAVLVGWGVKVADADVNPTWWLYVPAGVIAIVAAVFALAAMTSDRLRDLYADHFAGSVARVGVGIVVFISCSIGLYRTIVGTEWGMRNPGSNLETIAKQNNNLAGLGRAVRAVVPPDAVLFASGARLHHLQWAGNWPLFSSEYFALDRMQQMISRVPDVNEPDPIDPARARFLGEVYRGKDQRALSLDQARLVADALAAGRRVFYVLPIGTASTSFERRFPDAKQFTFKQVSSYYDSPGPRTPEDFLSPEERPKQPVNRFGGRNTLANVNVGGRETFRIAEITLRPPDPLPATKPATRPTTRPATRPATTTPSTSTRAA